MPYNFYSECEKGKCIDKCDYCDKCYCRECYDDDEVDILTHAVDVSNVAMMADSKGISSMVTTALHTMYQRECGDGREFRA